MVCCNDWTTSRMIFVVWGGKNKTMHKQNLSECILELKSHCNRYATGTKKWSALQHCDVVFFLSFFFFFFLLQLTVLLLLLLLGLCCKTGGGNIILIVRLSEWERRSKSQYFFLFILTYDEADLKMSISRFIWNGCYAAHKMLCLVIDHVVGV